MKKRKAKRKAKAKLKIKPTLAAAVRANTLAIAAMGEQMRVWELRIRGSLSQMAGVISEHDNVPALLKRISILTFELSALRIRMGVRAAEYTPEIPAPARCADAVDCRASEDCGSAISVPK